MGDHDVITNTDENVFRAFMQAILNDIRAMEVMLAHDMFADTEPTMGAEQELFILDSNYAPTTKALDILERIADDRFTTEIALFNLEANLTPRRLTGNCFRALEAELEEVLEIARQKAQQIDTDIVMVGILPTLNKNHLGLSSLTPAPRYKLLNNILTKSRGGDFQVAIRGLDEMHMSHDNVLLESATNSFQLHLQVGPSEFTTLYNTAQLVAAPVMAAATNSPMLMGKRLWHETRIALFQHAVDERSEVRQQRGHRSRVDFGSDWVKDSIVELYKEDLAEYRVLLTKPLTENSLELAQAGQVPELSAMRLHSGTIWRWNRACYGVKDGRAHLRIEARFLPAGPTLTDEVANAAFFMGLMHAVPEAYGDIRQHLSFDDARANFFNAAQVGLKAQFNWLDGQTIPATQLILTELLPLAYKGLEKLGVDEADRRHYLGIIEARTRTGLTGAQWLLGSLDELNQANSATPDQKSRTLVKAMIARQQTGKPVHEWTFAEPCGPSAWRHSYQTVGQFMKTKLFTVQPDDLIDLATNMMDWKHISHIPVEDDAGQLHGIVTHTDLLHLSARQNHDPLPVKEIMKTEPITVTSTTSTRQAIELMRHYNISCLPVVDNNRLVGMITAHDILDFAAHVFDELVEKETV